MEFIMIGSTNISRWEFNVLKKRMDNLAGIRRVMNYLQETVNDLEIKCRILNNDNKVLRRKVLKLEQMKLRKKRKTKFNKKEVNKNDKRM